MKNILLLCSILIADFTHAQSFAGHIDSIYNFKPHEQKDVVEKGKILDDFWKMVGNDTAVYLPQLRTELGNKHFDFFYYDGSMLLLSLTDSHADKSLAAEAISMCDTKDIIPSEYVRTVTDLGLDGINTSEACLNILKNPEFRFFIPENMFDFRHSYCLTYMLLPLSPETYLPALKKSFNQLSPSLQTSVLTALWFTYSCEGDQLMQTIASSKKYSKRIRDYAKDLLSRDHLAPEMAEVLKEVFKGDLVAEQHKMLDRFSEETIWGLDQICKLRRSKKSCR